MNFFSVFAFLFVLGSAAASDVVVDPEVLIQAIKDKASSRAKGLLLDGKVRVSAIEQHRDLALNIAIQSGQDEIAEILIKCGVNPLLTDWMGRCALHVATSAGNVHIIDMICESLKRSHVKPHDVIETMEDTAKDTPLMCAAERTGDTKVMQKFFEMGASVQAANSVGRTPLHVAVRNGDMAMVVFLLNNEADPIFADAEGVTPLDLATDDAIRTKLEIARRRMYE